jgi:hypothetical protein
MVFVDSSTMPTQSPLYPPMIWCCQPRSLPSPSQCSNDAPCAPFNAMHGAPCPAGSLPETIRTSATILGLSGSMPTMSPLAPAEPVAPWPSCPCPTQSIIQLVGRWRSDVMLRYLHLQAGALMSNLSSTMLQAVPPYQVKRRSRRAAPLSSRPLPSPSRTLLPAPIAPAISHLPRFAQAGPASLSFGPLFRGGNRWILVQAPSHSPDSITLNTPPVQLSIHSTVTEVGTGCCGHSR